MARLRKPKKIDPNIVLADGVAMAHFFVACVALVVGETTNVFTKLLKVEHPGGEFILKYLDWPVFSFLSGFNWFYWLREQQSTNTYYLSVFFIIIAASVFYGVVVYFISRLFTTLFGSDK